MVPSACTEQRCGPLVAVGGAEDKIGLRVVLREFLTLAGGAAARILVLPLASKQPEVAGRQYERLFGLLGAASTRVMDVRDHGDAHHPSAVCSVDEATGIFFTGGDQRDIVERLKRTPVGRAIRRAHLQGKAIGGTSAGAAALSDVMIADGVRSLDANGR